MSRRQRKRDLEQKIDIQYQLLGDYETKIDLSNEPKEKAAAKLEVEKIKERIKEYNEELATLRPSGSIENMLINSFKEINFTEQRYHITNFYEHSPTGAMLIHGKPNFGQSWLSFLIEHDFKNAFQEIPITKIEIDFNDFLFPNPWVKLLSELRNNFNIQGASEEDLVGNGIELILDRLKNEVILFLFKNPINFLHTDAAKKFLNEFWKPLGDKACASNDCKQLMCFIIEENQYIKNLETGLVANLDEHADFRKILKIPDIPVINEDDFKDWEKDFGKKRFDDLAKKIREVFINNDARRTAFLNQCQQGLPPISFFKELTETLGEDYTLLETENPWLRYEPTE